MIDHRFNFEIVNTAATNPGMEPQSQNDCPAVTFGRAPYATTTSIAPCANVPLQFLRLLGREATCKTLCGNGFGVDENRSVNYGTGMKGGWEETGRSGN